VSGQKKIGCNAIIVSGLRHELYNNDKFDTLVYCATTKEGGNSIVTSCIKNFPIRVFRSSRYKSRYRAIYKNNNHKVPKKAVYRYDGLYKVVDVAVRQGTSSTTPVLACRMIKL
jgi:SAD/SRA domain